MLRPRLTVTVLLTAVLGALSPTVASAAPAASPHPTPPDRPPAHAEHRLLVRFAPDADPDTVARGKGFRARAAVGRTGWTVVDTGTVAAAAARDRLLATTGVEDVELDLVRRIAAAPNDPGYTQGHQLPLQRVGLPAAWDIVKAASTQKVAVIDTGVNLTHPDLVGRLDLASARDFVEGDNTPQDENGHGTTVAGIAAADTNNNVGIAGASWGATIMPLRALDADGESSDSTIATAITWAVDHGATVVNLSLGGAGFTTALRNAINDAAARNVVVVAAAGNEGTSEPSYPAAFSSVLAVGATDSNGDLVYFSQHGPWVDIAAPGIDVLGPMHNSTTTYLYGIGTSFATPIVAGVAAMVRTWNPTLTAAQVVDRLQSTAQDNGPVGKDDSYGWGVLDAAGAVGGTAAADIPPKPGDGYEPNNTSSAATLITSSAGGTISPEGDVDWYAVDVPAAGNVTVTVTPDVDQTKWQAMDPTLELRSPGGDAVLGTVNEKGVDEAESLTVSVSAAGRYLVEVANVNGSRSPGAYSLTVSVRSAPARSGYWMVDATGHVYAFGQAGYFGAVNGARGNVVDLEPSPTGNGYWLLTSTGEIFVYGDAQWQGQPSGLVAGESVTSMSAQPGGGGYWVFTSKGRVFAFGGAPHQGDMFGHPLNGPVLDSVATPSGQGYYMVASDGGIFAFGDAAFRGSMGGRPLNAPVQSLVPDGDNDGYWLVASDGGVFAFNAAFRGSMGGRPLNKPMTGMVRFGNGYLMVAEDGGIFNFSDRPFLGSLGANPPASPVVAVAALEK